MYITVKEQPKLCKTYVDDTFIIQRADTLRELMEHINSIDPSVELITEGIRLMAPFPVLVRKFNQNVIEHCENICIEYQNTETSIYYGSHTVTEQKDVLAQKPLELKENI